MRNENVANHVSLLTDLCVNKKLLYTSWVTVTRRVVSLRRATVALSLGSRHYLGPTPLPA